MHKFLCRHNAISVHITYRDITVHTICEDLEIPSNHGKRYRESYMKCYSMHFMSNQALLKCKDHLRVQLYQLQHIWGIVRSQGNWDQISQIMDMDKQKVIPSVQLHISHQMKSCFSVNAIQGLSCKCFRVFGEFMETRLQCPDFKVLKAIFLFSLT